MKSIIFPFVLLFSIGLGAQSTVTGTVLDQEQNPVSFANVLLLQESDSTLVTGAISDENGLFLVSSPISGNFVLKVTFIGYEPHVDTIELTENETLELGQPIILSNSNVLLDEVELVGRKRLYERKIDRTVVNVKSSSLGAGSSALGVIGNSPGVVIDRSSGGISMLGKDGVIIYINGKRTRMDGTTLLRMLEGMPSSNIEQLELIHTPPANYDAEGNAGIINIVMDRELDEGFFGTVDLNSGYGDNVKYGAGINLQYNGEKTSVYGELTTNNDYNDQDMVIKKSYNFEGDSFISDLNSQRPSFTGFNQGRIGIDYKLTDRATIGAFLLGRLNSWSLDAFTTTENLRNGQLLSREILDSDERNNWKHYMGNIYLEHSLGEKTKLGLNYDYLNYRNNNDTDYALTFEDYILNTDATNDFRSRADTDTDFHVFNIDLNTALNDAWNLSLGAKGTISNFFNEVRVIDLENGAGAVENIAETRVLDENIWAGYIDSDYSFSDNTSVKLGARYEYTDSRFEIMSEDFSLIQNFGRVFPSAYVSHRFNDNLAMNLSYGERINRPSLNVLSPAFFFFDANTLVSGNPALRPVITRTLGYNLNYKGIDLLLQYNDQTNPFTFAQPAFSEDLSTTILTPEPLADRKLITGALSFPISFGSKLKSQHTINGNWKKEELVYEGLPVLRQGLYASLNSSFQYIMNSKLTADMALEYRSPRFRGLADIPYSWGLNIGAIYRLNKDFEMALSFRDIFDTNSFIQSDYDFPQDNVQFGSNYEFEGNIVSLRIKYNFGNRGDKEFNKRRTGSQEEQRRIQ